MTKLIFSELHEFGVTYVCSLCKNENLSQLISYIITDELNDPEVIRYRGTLLLLTLKVRRSNL